MSNSSRLSRRTVLRGIGVTMGLPWLESIPVWGATNAPKRFAVIFMGNGINGNHWWAKGQGAEMKLGKSLEPLEPIKKKINVINGAFQSALRRPGASTPDRQATCFRACRYSVARLSMAASAWTRCWPSGSARILRNRASYSPASSR